MKIEKGQVWENEDGKQYTIVGDPINANFVDFGEGVTEKKNYLVAYYKLISSSKPIYSIGDWVRKIPFSNCIGKIILISENDQNRTLYSVINYKECLFENEIELANVKSTLEYLKPDSLWTTRGKIYYKKEDKIILEVDEQKAILKVRDYINCDSWHSFKLFLDKNYLVKEAPHIISSPCDVPKNTVIRVTHIERMSEYKQLKEQYLNKEVRASEIIKLAKKYDVMLLHRNDEIHVMLDKQGFKFKQRQFKQRSI